jgi:ABC-2 type transport system ATP-binding protein
VNNVSLEVGAGTILGVLGPNGAGKTTAVRILTTLTRPDSGRAWVAGHDVVREATAVRGRIGVTGQDATLDESLTGRQNLTMVGELSRLKRSAARVRATELLDQFELSDAADRPVKTYSGGMRRRLDLAASLMARPPVLFLDEPTTGLDPTSRQRMWALIRDLVAEGVTVLLTTQYLDEADALANRIAVVDHGRLIAEGTPAELKASTGSQFLDIKLVSPHPRAVDVLKDLSIGTINVSESGRRLLVPARSQVGLAVAALRTLDEAGALVEDIAVHQPSLDDVFAVLTGTHETLALQEVPA